MAKLGATMKDIAEECGVSLSTVSLVLSNHPRISEETRSRVKAVVEQCGYQPDVHAKGLALQTSRTWSVVVPEATRVFSDVYVGEILSGIYDQACESKYKILLDVANPAFVERREYLNVLRGRRADGMLFVSAALTDTFLHDFERETFPFLIVNHYFPGSPLNYVVADYRETGRLAARHLLELGHREMGLVTGTNVQTALDFRAAFEEEAVRGGLRAEDIHWADGDFREEGGSAVTEQWLSKHPKLTAIMAGNDKMAIGAMRQLLARGKQIPEEVSVMGVDDIPAAEFTTPALTTVSHELYRMGQTACARLMSLSKGEQPSCQEVLPVKLILRESTGPAPGR